MKTQTIAHVISLFLLINLPAGLLAKEIKAPPGLMESKIRQFRSEAYEEAIQSMMIARADEPAPAISSKEGKALRGSLEKGIAEYRNEDYEEAVQSLIAARAEQPSSSVAAFYLGLSYKQTGQNVFAVSNFKDAISLTPPVADAYVELIEVLYNSGDLNEAHIWIAKAEGLGISPASVSFLKGLVLLKEDQNNDAIESFTKAKQLDKNLTSSADFQIAMALTKERRLKEAKESLKSVTAIDAKSDLTSFAKEYEAALSKALETYRTWRFTAGLAYQYDDNVVAKPSEAIPGVTFARHEDSSAIGTFRLDYAPMLSGPYFFNAQYSFYDNVHDHLSSHDMMSQSIVLVPGYNKEKYAFSLPVTYNHVLLHERKYISQITVKPTVSVLLTQNIIGQFTLGYSYRDMLKRALAPEEGRNGHIYSASAGIVNTFKEGRGMVNAKYEFYAENTDGINWDSRNHRISAGLLYPLFPKLNLIASGEIQMNGFNRVHTSFDVKRKDWIYVISTGLVYEILNGLNLNVQYSHNRADSNISVYDYGRNVFLAGLEYNF